jgi:protoheme IX farnesyltransferase
MISKIKNYYTLTKPGIIYGNAITATAGFLLASKGHVNFQLLIATLIGLSLVIASGCVINNYLDRDIDEKMERTKNRALAQGLISSRNAIVFAIILGLLGALVLIRYTNFLTVIIALAGTFVYVILYTVLLKRRSVHAALIGSIAGAVPPVAGYCAVTNNFDGGAILLFLILCFWQMPHFYAIALYRLNDYISAGVPVFPVKKGIPLTKIHMLFFIMVFIITTLLLTKYGYAGHVYALIATVVGFVWLWLCLKGFKTEDTRLWARRMFLLSLMVLMLFCLTISINSFSI